MSASIWPAMTEYVDAVQSERNLVSRDLRGLEVVTLPPLGLPAVASGRNAVVFQARLRGNDVALRCFTSNAGLGRERYIALEQHLSGIHHKALTPARWLDDAVLVGAGPRPAVVMDWVGGRPLSEWVGDRVHRPDELRLLAVEWQQLMSDLRSIRLAHGDLQHGNVLVTREGKLRLVDFDAVWVPHVNLSRPDEFGHPNYQHPDRAVTGAHGEHIDWFAALVVHVSLLALAVDPSLWARHTEENLIFTAEDFEGASEIWTTLSRSPDSSVVHGADLLARACAAPVDLATDLPTILRTGIPAATRRSASTSPPPPPPSTSAPWWDTSATTPSPHTVPPEPSPTPPRTPSTPPPRQGRTTVSSNSNWEATASDTPPTTNWYGGTSAPPPPPPDPRYQGGQQQAPAGTGPVMGTRLALSIAFLASGILLALGVQSSDLDPEMKGTLSVVALITTALGVLVVIVNARGASR